MAIKLLETPAIIIGAGPAGAGTSFFLTKHKIHHIVLEKGLFPRDKVCGDACSGKTALVINRANPEWLGEILKDEESYLPSWGITFVAPNGKALDIPFHVNRTAETKPAGFTAPRMDFDNFLFDKMQSEYCAIYQQAKVTSIETANGKVTVKMVHGGEDYEITSNIIVGADGDKGIVRKKFVNNNETPKSYAVGLRAYYEGITGLHEEKYLELHFLPEMLPGYLWIFPLSKDRANVGVGILSDVVRTKKINLREMMVNAIKTNPWIKERFATATLTDKIQGWGLPLASGQQQSLSGNNYMLTGDAASLIDPFSGEGIGNALYSGMLAADAIKQSLEQGNYSAAFFKEAYDNVVYKRLGEELRISAAMQKLCKYPWLFNFVVNKAHRSPVLKNTISCMFTDMDLRDRLRKPSFYFKILFNK